MVMSLEDGTYDFMLRGVIPLVVVPPGSLPPSGPRLRGAVRASNERARIAVSDDARMTSGVGVEFELSGAGQPLDVRAAIDYVRFVLPGQLDAIRNQPSRRYDSCMNVIVEAATLGFSQQHEALHHDQSLYTLLNLMVQGGGSPWFEEFYTLAGFMLVGDHRCRIYIRIMDSGVTYGLEIPLLRRDGKVLQHFGGSLPQELVPLLREGQLVNQPVVDTRDDYCAAVFDMARWIGPMVLPVEPGRD
ncbi:hypothetical protein Drose_25940 [Dactylosporangium roseum]|uniref:Uncharacterized protein n=1 Tax=Dactylosporangium roseum TaxID=47989 RepID=A0ABY5Z0N8_9ACTN|nr:hypothetical protein [Dactylosporangium roseum]UWZ34648.1 hypothetical protein Drose_25940 [Dactylosporangium roseum]